MLRRALTLLQGNARLFSFYVWSLRQHFAHLPAALSDTDTLDALLEAKKPFELVAPKGRHFIEQYEAGLAALGKELPAPGGGSFEQRQLLFWAVRLACVACAFQGCLALTVVASMLQFVLLPYSLFVALAYGCETMTVLYLGHLFAFLPLQQALTAAVPAISTFDVEIGPRFLVAFILIDQLACAICLFWLPEGEPAPMAWSRVLRSVGYGFLNCKSYYLVLLPLAAGVRLPLAALALDWALGISQKVADRVMRHWEVFFYHVHRLGHLRATYADAHKFHHHLPDSCAFDGHMFGSGAPEEWLLLMTDLALTSCGLMPGCLGLPALCASWLNKWSFHTRSCDAAANFHADHHLKHCVNFGLAPPFELFMGSAGAAEAEHRGFRVRREERGDALALVFAPLGDGPTLLRGGVAVAKK